MGTARRHFWGSEKGAVLVEALIVVPVFTILSVGILEFGNVLWQRHQLQTGVRDAGRYWSRCSPDSIGSWTGGACSIAIARNIAFYGNPAGSGALRIRNWDDATELTITPVNPVKGDRVTVSATLEYEGSPLIGLLGITGVELNYDHTERYIGW